MNIEKQLADAVRAMNDKKLAELALKMGFSLSIKPPSKAKPKSNGVANGKPKQRRRKKVEVKVTGAKVVTDSLKKIDKSTQKSMVFTKQWGNVLAKLQKDEAGMSSGELAAATKLDKNIVVKALKHLLSEKKIHRAGDRRFTRYATTKKAANDASAAARG